MNGLPIYHACAPLHGRLYDRPERRERSSKGGPGRISPRPNIFSLSAYSKEHTSALAWVNYLVFHSLSAAVSAQPAPEC